jgi:hypothetical protein
MYNVTPKPFMVRMAEDTQLYQVIHIDGMKLRYEARTATGELYDAFMLEKTIGEPNRMTEVSDLMAQRLRSNKAAAPTAPAVPPVPAVPATAK